MTYWVLVMAVVCVAALWWLYRGKIKSASRVADACDSINYHCVAITYRDNPCEAVKRLEGQRFLSAEAPLLPLQGCASDSCQCRYVHYDDRRADDRRNPYGRHRSTPPASINQERRTKTGRRSTDIVELDDHGIHDLSLDKGSQSKTSRQRASWLGAYALLGGAQRKTKSLNPRE